MTLADTPPLAAAEAAATSQARLMFLDGWRALAVLIVITSHVTGFRHEPAFLKFLGRWLPAGEIGVLIFFFISGFVISRSALIEIATTSSFSQKAFYIRRAFRIIPPLVLYLVVCLLLGAAGLVDFHIGNAIPALLYVCNIDPFNTCIWLGGHTWSLAFEEQFYLLFPALLWVFVLHRTPFVPHLVGAVVFCLLPLIFPLSYSNRLGFVEVYGLFGAGIFAARHAGRIGPLVERYAAPGFVVGAAIVFLTPLTLPYRTLAYYYPLAFILAIPVMVLCAGSTPFVSSVLTNGALRYIGRISYAIYLWQELATSDLFRHGSLALELLALVGVLVLCAILFETMEKPLIQLGRQLSKAASTSALGGRQAPAPGRNGPSS